MQFDAFLKEIATLLGLQWRPFKKEGIKRRLDRRIVEVGLSSFEQYLEKIREDPSEQSSLAGILTVTISRLFRDHEVFKAIMTSVLPTLLKTKNRSGLKVWSIGCASGEEPYSLSILWKEAFEKDWPAMRVTFLATDIDERLLMRAKSGRYKVSSLKEVPEEIRRKYFESEEGLYLLNKGIRESVVFRRHDILREEPSSEIDIIFCRNLAFTYFSKDSQIEVLKKIAGCLKEGGYLVIGRDESLPLVYPTLFVPVFPEEKIYQKFTIGYES
jgi:chemotaxis protein methyltransferase CheR